MYIVYFVILHHRENAMGWDYIHDVGDVRSGGRPHIATKPGRTIQVYISRTKSGVPGYVNLTPREWRLLQNFTEDHCLAEIMPRDYLHLPTAVRAVIEDWLTMAS